MPARYQYAFKGLQKRRTQYGLRTKWLAFCFILLIIELIVVYFRIHDVILVISLHLNIKLDWIRGLENSCQDLESNVRGSHKHDHKLIDGSHSNIKVCPEMPPNLLGKVNLGDEDEEVKMDDLISNLTWVNEGGRFKPTGCVPRQKVAIIVPHRNREPHLRQFLKNIHPMMRRQQADYKIYVIQQDGNEIFNKAKLLNIGFREASKEDNYDCFVFHDVDLLAEDDRNLYRCAEVPRHLSVGIDKWDYQLPYDALFGGVIAMTKSQFMQVSFFSNSKI